MNEIDPRAVDSFLARRRNRFARLGMNASDAQKQQWDEDCNLLHAFIALYPEFKARLDQQDAEKQKATTSDEPSNP